ncbi:MAG TPA: hypothetical protein PK595_00310 [Bacteroidota bacterium]|nr:hypothetical protein [Bacteroidota bacterium]
MTKVYDNIVFGILLASYILTGVGGHVVLVEMFGKKASTIERQMPPKTHQRVAYWTQNKHLPSNGKITQDLSLHILTNSQLIVETVCSYGFCYWNLKPNEGIVYSLSSRAPPVV